MASTKTSRTGLVISDTKAKNKLTHGEANDGNMKRLKLTARKSTHSGKVKEARLLLESLATEAKSENLPSSKSKYSTQTPGQEHQRSTKAKKSMTKSCREQQTKLKGEDLRSKRNFPVSCRKQAELLRGSSNVCLPKTPPGGADKRKERMSQKKNTVTTSDRTFHLTCKKKEDDILSNYRKLVTRPEMLSISHNGGKKSPPTKSSGSTTSPDISPVRVSSRLLYRQGTQNSTTPTSSKVGPSTCCAPTGVAGCLDKELTKDCLFDLRVTLEPLPKEYQHLVKYPCKKSPTGATSPNELPCRGKGKSKTSPTSGCMSSVNSNSSLLTGHTSPLGKRVSTSIYSSTRKRSVCGGTTEKRKLQDSQGRGETSTTSCTSLKKAKISQHQSNVETDRTKVCASPKKVCSSPAQTRKDIPSSPLKKARISQHLSDEETDRTKVCASPKKVCRSPTQARKNLPSSPLKKSKISQHQSYEEADKTDVFASPKKVCRSPAQARKDVPSSPSAKVSGTLRSPLKRECVPQDQNTAAQNTPARSAIVSKSAEKDNKSYGRSKQGRGDAFLTSVKKTGSSSDPFRKEEIIHVVSSPKQTGSTQCEGAKLLQLTINKSQQKECSPMKLSAKKGPSSPTPPSSALSIIVSVPERGNETSNSNDGNSSGESTNPRNRQAATLSSGSAHKKTKSPVTAEKTAESSSAQKETKSPVTAEKTAESSSAQKETKSPVTAEKTAESSSAQKETKSPVTAEKTAESSSAQKETKSPVTAGKMADSSRRNIFETLQRDFLEKYNFEGSQNLESKDHAAKKEARANDADNCGFKTSILPDFMGTNAVLRGPDSVVKFANRSLWSDYKKHASVFDLQVHRRDDLTDKLSLSSGQREKGGNGSVHQELTSGSMNDIPDHTRKEAKLHGPLWHNSIPCITSTVNDSDHLRSSGNTVAQTQIEENTMHSDRLDACPVFATPNSHISDSETDDELKSTGTSPHSSEFSSCSESSNMYKTPEKITSSPYSPTVSSPEIEQVRPDFDEIDGVMFMSFSNRDAIRAHANVEASARKELGVKHIDFFRDISQYHAVATQKKDSEGKKAKKISPSQENRSMRGIHMKNKKYEQMLKTELRKMKRYNTLQPALQKGRIDMKGLPVSLHLKELGIRLKSRNVLHGTSGTLPKENPNTGSAQTSATQQVERGIDDDDDDDDDDGDNNDHPDASKSPDKTYKPENQVSINTSENISVPDLTALLKSCSSTTRNNQNTMPKHEETLGVQENFALRHFENPVNTKKSAFVSDTLDEYLKENQHIRGYTEEKNAQSLSETLLQKKTSTVTFKIPTKPASSTKIKTLHSVMAKKGITLPAFPTAKAVKKASGTKKSPLLKKTTNKKCRNRELQVTKKVPSQKQLWDSLLVNHGKANTRQLGSKNSKDSINVQGKTSKSMQKDMRHTSEPLCYNGGILLKNTNDPYHDVLNEGTQLKIVHSQLMQQLPSKHKRKSTSCSKDDKRDDKTKNNQKASRNIVTVNRAIAAVSALASSEVEASQCLQNNRKRSKFMSQYQRKKFLKESLKVLAANVKRPKKKLVKVPHKKQVHVEPEGKVLFEEEVPRPIKSDKQPDYDTQSRSEYVKPVIGDWNTPPPCGMEYCRLGCICHSVKEPCDMSKHNNHCKKEECMLKCVCFDRKKEKHRSTRVKKRPSFFREYGMLFYDGAGMFSADNAKNPKLLWQAASSQVNEISQAKQKRVSKKTSNLSVSQRGSDEYDKYIYETESEDDFSAGSCARTMVYHRQKRQQCSCRTHVASASCSESERRNTQIPKTMATTGIHNSRMLMHKLQYLGAPTKKFNTTLSSAVFSSDRISSLRILPYNRQITSISRKALMAFNASTENAASKKVRQNDSSAIPAGTAKSSPIITPLSSTEPTVQGSKPTMTIQQAPKVIEIVSDCDWAEDKDKILKCIAKHSSMADKSECGEMRVGRFKIEIMSGSDTSKVNEIKNTVANGPGTVKSQDVSTSSNGKSVQHAAHATLPEAVGTRNNEAHVEANSKIASEELEHSRIASNTRLEETRAVKKDPSPSLVTASTASNTTDIMSLPELGILDPKSTSGTVLNPQPQLSKCDNTVTLNKSYSEQAIISIIAPPALVPVKDRDIVCSTAVTSQSETSVISTLSPAMSSSGYVAPPLVPVKDRAVICSTAVTSPSEVPVTSAMSPAKSSSEAVATALAFSKPSVVEGVDSKTMPATEIKSTSMSILEKSSSDQAVASTFLSHPIASITTSSVVNSTSIKSIPSEVSLTTTVPTITSTDANATIVFSTRSESCNQAVTSTVTSKASATSSVSSEVSSATNSTLSGAPVISPSRIAREETLPVTETKSLTLPYSGNCIVTSSLNKLPDEQTVISTVASPAILPVTVSTVVDSAVAHSPTPTSATSLLPISHHLNALTINVSSPRTSSPASDKDKSSVLISPQELSSNESNIEQNVIRLPISGICNIDNDTRLHKRRIGQDDKFTTLDSEGAESQGSSVHLQEDINQPSQTDHELTEEAYVEESPVQAPQGNDSLANSDTASTVSKSTEKSPCTNTEQVANASTIANTPKTSSKQTQPIASTVSKSEEKIQPQKDHELTKEAYVEESLEQAPQGNDSLAHSDTASTVSKSTEKSPCTNTELAANGSTIANTPKTSSKQTQPIAFISVRHQSLKGQAVLVPVPLSKLGFNYNKESTSLGESSQPTETLQTLTNLTLSKTGSAKDKNSNLAQGSTILVPTTVVGDRQVLRPIFIPNKQSVTIPPPTKVIKAPTLKSERPGFKGLMNRQIANVNLGNQAISTDSIKVVVQSKSDAGLFGVVSSKSDLPEIKLQSGVNCGRIVKVNNVAVFQDPDARFSIIPTKAIGVSGATASTSSGTVFTTTSSIAQSAPCRSNTTVTCTVNNTTSVNQKVISVSGVKLALSRTTTAMKNAMLESTSTISQSKVQQLGSAKEEISKSQPSTCNDTQGNETFLMSTTSSNMQKCTISTPKKSNKEETVPCKEQQHASHEPIPSKSPSAVQTSEVVVSNSEQLNVSNTMSPTKTTKLATSTSSIVLPLRQISSQSHGNVSSLVLSKPTTSVINHPTVSSTATSTTLNATSCDQTVSSCETKSITGMSAVSTSSNTLLAFPDGSGSTVVNSKLGFHVTPSTSASTYVMAKSTSSETLPTHCGTVVPSQTGIPSRNQGRLPPSTTRGTLPASVTNMATVTTINTKTVHSALHEKAVLAEESAPIALQGEIPAKREIIPPPTLGLLSTNVQAMATDISKSIPSIKSGVTMSQEKPTSTCLPTTLSSKPVCTSDVLPTLTCTSTTTAPLELHVKSNPAAPVVNSANIAITSTNNKPQGRPLLPKPAHSDPPATEKPSQVLWIRSGNTLHLATPVPANYKDIDTLLPLPTTDFLNTSLSQARLRGFVSSSAMLNLPTMATSKTNTVCEVGSNKLSGKVLFIPKQKEQFVISRVCDRASGQDQSTPTIRNSSPAVTDGKEPLGRKDEEKSPHVSLQCEERLGSSDEEFHQECEDKEAGVKYPLLEAFDLGVKSLEPSPDDDEIIDVESIQMTNTFEQGGNKKDDDLEEEMIDVEECDANGTQTEQLLQQLDPNPVSVKCSVHGKIARRKRKSPLKTKEDLSEEALFVDSFKRAQSEPVLVSPVSPCQGEKDPRLSSVKQKQQQQMVKQQSSTHRHEYTAGLQNVTGDKKSKQTQRSGESHGLHNFRERERRSFLSELFSNLRKIVGLTDEPKVAKITILAKSHEEIKNLKEINTKLYRVKSYLLEERKRKHVQLLRSLAYLASDKTIDLKQKIALINSIKDMHGRQLHKLKEEERTRLQQRGKHRGYRGKGISTVNTEIHDLLSVKVDLGKSMKSDVGANISIKPEKEDSDSSDVRMNSATDSHGTSHVITDSVEPRVFHSHNQIDVVKHLPKDIHIPTADERNIIIISGLPDPPCPVDTHASDENRNGNESEEPVFIPSDSSSNAVASSVNSDTPVPVSLSMSAIYPLQTESLPFHITGHMEESPLGSMSPKLDAKESSILVVDSDGSVKSMNMISVEDNSAADIVADGQQCKLDAANSPKSQHSAGDVSITTADCSPGPVESSVVIPIPDITDHQLVDKVNALNEKECVNARVVNMKISLGGDEEPVELSVFVPAREKLPPPPEGCVEYAISEQFDGNTVCDENDHQCETENQIDSYQGEGMELSQDNVNTVGQQTQGLSNTAQENCPSMDQMENNTIKEGNNDDDDDNDDDDGSRIIIICEDDNKNEGDTDLPSSPCIPLEFVDQDSPRFLYLSDSNDSL